MFEDKLLTCKDCGKDFIFQCMNRNSLLRRDWNTHHHVARSAVRLEKPE